MTERQPTLLDRLLGRVSEQVGPPGKSEGDAIREKDYESVERIRDWIATAWPEPRELSVREQSTPWAVYH